MGMALIGSSITHSVASFLWVQRSTKHTREINRKRRKRTKERKDGMKDEDTHLRMDESVQAMRMRRERQQNSERMSSSSFSPLLSTRHRASNSDSTLLGSVTDLIDSLSCAALTSQHNSTHQ